MQAVDRHRKMVGKDDAQDKLIKYMYETKAGRVITSFLIKPWLSEACKTILDMRSSRLLIPLFIKANNIDMRKAHIRIICHSMIFLQEK